MYRPMNSNQENSQPPEIDPLIRLYARVGGYFKWTWKEFCETPWPVIKQLAQLLDASEHDLDRFIGLDEAALFKNLRRLFPPKSD